jgi:hypothetical protein
MSAEARAFKRAARYLGIGRFLYSFPRVYGKVEPLGKRSWSIPPTTQSELLELTAFLIEHPRDEVPKLPSLWVFQEIAEPSGGVDLPKPAKKAARAKQSKPEPKEAPLAGDLTTQFWTMVYSQQIPREVGSKILMRHTTESGTDWAAAMAQLAQETPKK